jgi:hypothetical protein
MAATAETEGTVDLAMEKLVATVAMAVMRSHDYAGATAIHIQSGEAFGLRWQAKRDNAFEIN